MNLVKRAPTLDEPMLIHDSMLALVVFQTRCVCSDNGRCSTHLRRKPLTAWNLAIAFPVSRLRESCDLHERLRFDFFGFRQINRETVAHQALKFLQHARSKL